MTENAATDSPLNQPLTLPCGVTIPNRLLKSAMTEGLADAHDRPTAEHVTLYRRWSEGGTGLLISGNVMVDRRYLERAGNVVMDGNGGEDQIRAYAEAGQAAGNQMWAQINHPGRQCQKIVNPNPMSPSDVKVSLAGMFAKPRTMTVDDIEDAISRYIRVAAQCKELGFSGVQIHAAHGYLISQFHSPYTNRREDEWGGSLENRARFLLRVTEGVRKAVGPDYPVAVKLNSADFQKGAFTLEDSAKVVELLNERGLDLLEISGGTYEQIALMGDLGDESSASEVRESTKRREAYFLEYAKVIREVAKMPFAVTGGFRDRQLMEDVVSNGEVDMVGLARPLCADPELSNKLLSRTIDRAPDPENTHLTLGRSANGGIMKLLHAGAVYWFYAQIEEIAAGREPDLSISHLAAVWRHMRNEFRRIGARKKNYRPQN